MVTLLFIYCLILTLFGCCVASKGQKKTMIPFLADLDWDKATDHYIIDHSPITHYIHSACFALVFAFVHPDSYV